MLVKNIITPTLVSNEGYGSAFQRHRGGTDPVVAVRRRVVDPV